MFARAGWTICGPLPLPLRKATTATLSASIEQLVSTDRYADWAASLARGIAPEDGTGDAVRVL